MKIANKIVFTLVFCMIIVHANSQIETQIRNNSIISHNKLKGNRNQLSTTWLPVENVSNHIGYDSWDPSIAIGQDGTLHVVYCDNVPYAPPYTSQRIHYRSKESNGLWSDSLIIDAFSEVPSRNSYEPSIAISENGDIHVVFHYYDFEGNFLKQIGYTKYDCQSDKWSTEVISGDSGTISITYSAYPRILTCDNNPVIAWCADNRSGTNEAYLIYKKDDIWSEPVLISERNIKESSWPKILKISPDEVFIAFFESNLGGDSLSINHRVFNLNDGTLSEVREIIGTKRALFYPLLFDICLVNEDQIFLAYNSNDTIHTYNYNISQNLFVKNLDILVSNLSHLTNSNMPSICVDSYERIHIVYVVWNNQNLFYVTYKNTEGFSEPIELTSDSACYDMPQVIYGSDGFLHLVFADNRYDFNGNTFDRQVLYTKKDIASGIENDLEIESIFCYPNPASSRLHLSCEEKIKDIYLINLNGKIYDHFSHLNQYNVNISVSNLPKGIYIVKVVTKKKYYFKKIIIQ